MGPACVWPCVGLFARFDSDRSFTLAEFGAHLARVGAAERSGTSCHTHRAFAGIEEETEHQAVLACLHRKQSSTFLQRQNIFGAIRDPHSSHQTVPPSRCDEPSFHLPAVLRRRVPEVTLEMLAAAMSAISPSLLLEERSAQSGAGKLSC